MKIIDLSHTIQADMPVFPGTAPPMLEAAHDIARHGFSETMLHMLSHTGTHIDAPSHMLPQGKNLDDFPIEQFFGVALIIDFPHCAGTSIEFKSLQQMREKIAHAEFVLFNTGHSQKWGAKEYFADFTTLSEAAAAYLAGFPLKGVGIDAVSFDPLEQSGNPVHHILLNKGMILIENLCNLREVKGEYCMFAALPLKYGGADGSPVRAIAIDMETKFYSDKI
ncbi:MAG: cyclase family protein [Clostridiales bacterium]|nr:cyclase family protein [Clostridiales bacterium]